MASREIPFQSAVRHAMKQTIQASADWKTSADELASFYRKAGSGIIGRYKAFRWNSKQDTNPLEGIARPDPVSLDELIGRDGKPADAAPGSGHVVKIPLPEEFEAGRINEYALLVRHLPRS